MKHHRFSLSFIISIIILLSVFGLIAVPFSSQAAPDNSPQATIQRAWEMARQSESYNFTTRLVETTHPAPSISNVGRDPRVETVYLEGETDLAEDILLMRIWQNGGRLSDLSQAAEIRAKNGKTFGRQGGGTWQEIDNFADSLAPGSDASAFLVAARNVALAPPYLHAAHYTFNLIADPF